MLINQFITYLQTEKGYSDKTVISYKCDLNQFKDFILADSDHFLLDKIDAYDIRRWIVKMIDEGITARTVTRKISTLRTFYKFLKRQGLITSDPLRKVVLPKIEKRLPSNLREEEMSRLLDQISFPDTFEGIRDNLILELFYDTGMRLSELIHLRDFDIQLHNRVVLVTGKRNKQRLVPVNQIIIEKLEIYLQLRNKLFNQTQYLFVTIKGNELYPKLVYNMVKHYLNMVTTISHKSPHVLRHTFATVLLNRGAELKIIKELMGHSNLSATEVYTHNTFKELSQVYKQAHPRA